MIIIMEISTTIVIFGKNKNSVEFTTISIYLCIVFDFNNSSEFTSITIEYQMFKKKLFNQTDQTFRVSASLMCALLSVWREHKHAKQNR